MESRKEESTEAVQNFTLRFRQIINEINYAVLAQHTNPMEKRLKIKLEEQEHATETEMWLKETQPTRTSTLPPRPTTKFISRLPPSPGTNANTSEAKSLNQTLLLINRSKMTCHKCGKIGHFSSQYVMKKNSKHAKKQYQMQFLK